MVITILGILAGIVVFAVLGLGDKGASSAVVTDASTLRTAEEAYCANHNSYASVTELVTPADGKGGFLSQPPTLNGVVLLPNGPCGTAPATASNAPGYVIGSTQGLAPAAGAVAFANANNTAPVFNFMQQDFQNASGSSVSFSAPANGASGPLKTSIDTSNPPYALFASADLANVLGVVKSGTATSVGTGTCGAALNCPGIASTAVQYATGHLVIESCVSGGQSLVPAPGAPNCAPPAGGYIATPPQTVANVVTDLEDTAGHPNFVLAMADPGQAAHTGSTGGPAAPYGLAAYQSLLASGMVAGATTDNTAAQCAAGSYQACVNMPSPRIRFTTSGGPSGLTGAQTLLFTGQATTAMVALSQVQSPVVNDTNAWFQVPDGLHSPINQAMILIDQTANAGLGAATPSVQNPAAAAFEAYVVSPKGQAILKTFGYN